MRTATALALAALVLAGCSVKGSMRPTVNLTINTPQPYTVQAWGYPTSQGDHGADLYYSLSVSLQVAAPFVFVFPDGFRADSRRIDADVLAAHLAPVVAGKDGRRSAALSRSDRDGRTSIVFTLDAAGRATRLWLYACKHGLPGIIGKADGANVLDFPLRRHELEAVFGPATHTGADFVLLGYECD